MVKNGQKLKKGSFFPIKTLTREMSPNGMIQETRKKTGISDVVAAILKKPYFLKKQKIKTVILQMASKC